MSLWCKLIKSIYGDDWGLKNDLSFSKSSSPWGNIINPKREVSKANINLHSLFLIKSR